MLPAAASDDPKVLSVAGRLRPHKRALESRGWVRNSMWRDFPTSRVGGGCAARGKSILYRGDLRAVLAQADRAALVEVIANEGGPFL